MRLQVCDKALEGRAIGAYLGLAVGDALGASVEFMAPRKIRARHGVHDTIRGGGWLNLRVGQVTDDTAMALSLGESILTHGGVDANAVAGAFSEWMRGKPVDIGNTVRRGIIQFRRSGEVAVPVNEYDAGNGACMRVLPVALAMYGQPPETVQQACRAQAHVTHNNPLSDAGTECVAAMVQAALQGMSKVSLLHGPVRDLVKRQPVFAFRIRRSDNPSAYIVETLRVVFQSFFDSDDFESCVIEVVNRGGDADTTGAIVGMIAGAVYGVDAIPAAWLGALDENIRVRCIAQACSLIKLAG